WTEVIVESIYKEKENIGNRPLPSETSATRKLPRAYIAYYILIFFVAGAGFWVLWKQDILAVPRTVPHHTGRLDSCASWHCRGSFLPFHRSEIT
ncbi:MAG: hypothetical protein AAB209_02895, partial [Bacteroidota bacterium]